MRHGRCWTRFRAFRSPRINDLSADGEEARKRKFWSCRVILGASVIATLLVVILSILSGQQHTVHPLRDLLELADEIGQGNLPCVPTERGRRNRALGQAFNHMAEGSLKLYQNLESAGEEKTAS